MISNLPAGVTLSELTYEICGGLLVAVKLYDTLAIANSLTARVVFFKEHDAAGYTSFRADHPLRFGARTAEIRHLASPTWPLAQRTLNNALERGATRCLTITDYPLHLSVNDLFAELSDAEYKSTHGIISVRKDGRRLLHVSFESIDRAGWGLARVNNFRVFIPAKASFAPDPCARPLETLLPGSQMQLRDRMIQLQRPSARRFSAGVGRIPSRCPNLDEPVRSWLPHGLAYEDDTMPLKLETSRPSQNFGNSAEPPPVFHSGEERSEEYHVAQSVESPNASEVPNQDSNIDQSLVNQSETNLRLEVLASASIACKLTDGPVGSEDNSHHAEAEVPEEPTVQLKNATGSEIAESSVASRYETVEGMGSSELSDAPWTTPQAPEKSALLSKSILDEGIPPSDAFHFSRYSDFSALSPAPCCNSTAESGLQQPFKSDHAVSTVLGITPASTRGMAPGANDSPEVATHDVCTRSEETHYKLQPDFKSQQDIASSPVLRAVPVSSPGQVTQKQSEHLMQGQAQPSPNAESHQPAPGPSTPPELGTATQSVMKPLPSMDIERQDGSAQEACDTQGSLSPKEPRSSHSLRRSTPLDYSDIDSPAGAPSFSFPLLSRACAPTESTITKASSDGNPGQFEGNPHEGEAARSGEATSESTSSDESDKNKHQNSFLERERRGGRIPSPSAVSTPAASLHWAGEEEKRSNAENDAGEVGLSVGARDRLTSVLSVSSTSVLDY